MIKTSEKIFREISTAVGNYVVGNNKSAMILNCSGSVDSCLCAAICSEAAEMTDKLLICITVLNSKTKKSDYDRGVAIAKSFGDIHFDCNIIDEEKFMMKRLGVTNEPHHEKRMKDAASRIRMIHIQDLASRYSGIVIGCRNKTEHDLGYWTLYGDEGDIFPLTNITKSKVYEIMTDIKNHYKTTKREYLHRKERIICINESIKATPRCFDTSTTSSDFEYFNIGTYEDPIDGYKYVDNILETYKKVTDNINENLEKEYKEMTKFKVVELYENSIWKRNHPVHLKHN